jgi:hypothetical protein
MQVRKNHRTRKKNRLEYFTTPTMFQLIRSVGQKNNNNATTSLLKLEVANGTGEIVSPAASPENTLEAVSARQLTGKGYATNSRVCDDAAVKVLTAN